MQALARHDAWLAVTGALSHGHCEGARICTDEAVWLFMVRLLHFVSHSRRHTQCRLLLGCLARNDAARR